MRKEDEKATSQSDRELLTASELTSKEKYSVYFGSCDKYFWKVLFKCYNWLPEKMRPVFCFCSNTTATAVFLSCGIVNVHCRQGEACSELWCLTAVLVHVLCLLSIPLSPAIPKDAPTRLLPSLLWKTSFLWILSGEWNCEALRQDVR